MFAIVAASVVVGALIAAVPAAAQTHKYPKYDKYPAGYCKKYDSGHYRWKCKYYDKKTDKKKDSYYKKCDYVKHYDKKSHKYSYWYHCYPPQHKRCYYDKYKDKDSQKYYYRWYCKSNDKDDGGP